MKKRYIISVILICFIVFIFILGNLESSNNTNNHQIAYFTYTNQNMSFEYPTGWQAENNGVGGVNVYNGSQNNHRDWFTVNTVSMADYNLIASVISEIQYPSVQTSDNISIATIQNQILNNNTLATIISDIQPNIIQNQTLNNSAIASITSTLEASTIQNQTINNTNYTSVDPNPNSGDYSWKYCFFTKNNEGIVIAGYVDNIAVLEHVVATFH
jgi:hypothetical protein